MSPYWQSRDGRIVLYHGDCRDLMAGLADKSVDHVITDPPYEAEAHTLQRRVKRSEVAALEPLSFPPLTPELRTEYADAFARIARRWVLTFCQVEAAMSWRHALERSRALNYRRTCVWVKPDGQPQLSGDRPGMGYESLVCCHAKGKSRWNGGGKTGVFIVNKNDPAFASGNIHQTQKPTQLMRQLVSLFTDPNELILDPFAGSATTLVAAHEQGRRAIGCELDEKNAEAAAKRLEALTAQGALFGT